MPDLHLDALNAFWDSYDRRTLYRVIVALERVEHWMLDSIPAVEAALIQLGEAMDQASGFELTAEAKVIRVLANARASRALRLQLLSRVFAPQRVSLILKALEQQSE